jgi:predicted PhzF superfamily epimerase YddE/YHI9
MLIQEFTCFAAGTTGGNPALTVEDGPIGAEQRLALARKRGLTCVFLDPSAEPGIAACLDFVYPHTRSPLCLHATLAAAQVLFERHGAVVPLTVATAMRGQRLVLLKDGAEVFVRTARKEVPKTTVDAPLVARLLAAPSLSLASAPCLASVGSPKLLLEVANVETLYSLRPDLPFVHDWGKAHGVSGCFAWCRLADGRYEGRNFNHLDPKLEDSATGVAAGALTVALGSSLTLLQGAATGRSSVIRTRLDAGDVMVGGKVHALSTLES